MGIKGTEVTKETAGMIVADDNSNVAQGAVIAIAILFAFTLPITAPQVLWVNMVTMRGAAISQQGERP